MAGGISIHGVDVAQGAPAAGLLVDLDRLDGDRRTRLASGRLGSNGLLDHPTARGDGVTEGVYEATFHIGAYLRDAGYPPAQCGFLDAVPFRFTVRDAAQHYHLPLKFTPWGIMLFRGS